MDRGAWWAPVQGSGLLNFMMQFLIINLHMCVCVCVFNRRSTYTRWVLFHWRVLTNTTPFFKRVLSSSMNILRLFISTLSCNRNCERMNCVNLSNLLGGRSTRTYREGRRTRGVTPGCGAPIALLASQWLPLPPDGTHSSPRPGPHRALPARPQARTFLIQAENIALSSSRGA